MSCIDEFQISGRSFYLLTGWIIVCDCFFHRLNKFNDNGGVIYCSNNGNINILYSVFSCCGTLKSGGAIYIVANSSTIENICSFNCSCSEYGGFGYFTSINRHNYSSISNSSSTLYGAYAILYSKTISNNMNVTFSNGPSGSSAYIYKTTEIAIYFSCFCCSKASSWGVFYHEGYGGGITNITYNNIHNNTCSSYGIIYSYKSSFHHYKCHFSGNSGTLVYGESSELRFFNCYMSHSGTKISQGVYTMNCSDTTFQIPFAFTIYQTYLCMAENPFLLLPDPTQTQHVTQPYVSYARNVFIFELLTI